MRYEHIKLEHLNESGKSKVRNISYRCSTCNKWVTSDNKDSTKVRARKCADCLYD